MRSDTVVMLCAAPYGAAGTAVAAASAEPALRAAIAAAIDARAPVCGFVCPAPGPGLIFAEEMRARGADLHLLLPCPAEDFLDAHAAPAGEAVLARTRALLDGPARVELSGEERLAGDETQLSFNNLMLQGRARLEAEARGLPAHLLAAWSPSAPAEIGSPAEFIDQWPEIERLSLIDLDEILGGAAAESDLDLGPDMLAFGASPLVVRAILFADLATYSSLRDEEVPLLWDFLAEVQQGVERDVPAPILINTWGDAVHAAAETATDLARYAAALVEGTARLDPAPFGLRQQPVFRLALHAGPVYVGLHPLTGRSMVYGRHVNRGARIEPVSIKGEICASQHFVSLLRAEMDARAHEARLTGRETQAEFEMSFLGDMELPKKFGREMVWRLARTPAAAGGADGAPKGADPGREDAP